MAIPRFPLFGKLVTADECGGWAHMSLSKPVLNWWRGQNTLGRGGKCNPLQLGYHRIGLGEMKTKVICQIGSDLNRYTLLSRDRCTISCRLFLQSISVRLQHTPFFCIAYTQGWNCFTVLLEILTGNCTVLSEYNILSLPHFHQLLRCLLFSVFVLCKSCLP